MAVDQQDSNLGRSSRQKTAQGGNNLTLDPPAQEEHRASPIGIERNDYEEVRKVSCHFSLHLKLPDR